MSSYFFKWPSLISERKKNKTKNLQTSFHPRFYLESESEITQSCPTLWDPMDCSLPFSIRGILQARILEWVAISFSRRSSQPRDQTWVSRIAGRRFTVWATSSVLFTENSPPPPPTPSSSYVQFSSVQLFSHFRLFATPWIAACQASLSITNSFLVPLHFLP